MYSFSANMHKRIRQNKNALIVVVGETGSGKSYTALRLAEEIDPTFNVDRIVYSIEDLMDLINSNLLPKGGVIIVDESGVLVPSREWYSLSNRVLNYVLQTFRQDNLILFFCVPDMSFIDSQTRKLFHYILQPISINRTTDEITVKVQRILVKPKGKDPWYVFPRYAEEDMINVVSGIRVGLPSLILRRRYEEKKKDFRNRLGANIIEDLKSTKSKSDDKLKATTTDHAAKILANPALFQGTYQSRTFFDVHLIKAYFNLSENKAREVKALATSQYSKKHTPRTVSNAMST